MPYNPPNPARKREAERAYAHRRRERQEWCPSVSGPLLSTSRMPSEPVSVRCPACGRALRVRWRGVQGRAQGEIPAHKRGRRG